MVRKKEDGGIHYAANIMLLVTVCVTLYFLVYRTQLLVAKDELANGLQVCVNYIIADSSVDTFQTPAERERGKRHVLSAVAAYDDFSRDTLGAGAQSPGAKEQARKLAGNLLTQLKKQFRLDASYVPESGTLAEAGTGKIILEELEFYEGIYQTAGKRPDYYVLYRVRMDGNNGILSVDDGVRMEPSDGGTDYSNVVVHGKKLAGSTVYAKISYTLYTPHGDRQNFFGPVVRETVKVYQDCVADVVIRQ